MSGNRPVTIRVWRSNQSRQIGHASIEFNSEYVSFWPTSSRREYKKSGPAAKAFGRADSVWNSYNEDRAEEDGTEDVKVDLYSLNTDSMERELGTIKAECPRWSLAGGSGCMNCCQVVQRLLNAGGAEKLASWPWRMFSVDPNDVADFVQAARNKE